jgi:hypothetical protein
MFEGWSPEQRKLAMYGAPLVGAVVVGMKVRSNNAAKAAAAAAAKAPANAIPTIATPSTNVVGVDQLAAYENSVTAVLDHIASAVDNLTHPPTPTPAPGPQPPPPTIVPPPPVPPLPVPGIVTTFNYATGPGDTANIVNAALAHQFGQQVDPARAIKIVHDNNLAGPDVVIPTGTILKISSAP